MELKTRTKIGPKSGAKMQSGAPNLRVHKDVQRSSSFSGLLGDLIQLCNKPTTSTKERRKTWAGKIAQTERMNTFTGQTKHSQDMFYSALVLEPHFAQSCGRFLLLYCILGWQSLLQASFHWKMQNVKLPVSNTCGLHMFKQ